MNGTKRALTTVTLLLTACSGGAGSDLSPIDPLAGIDLGVADPSATRAGPVHRAGSPSTTPGAPSSDAPYAPYAPGDRVDLGSADVVLAGPEFTQAGTTVAMPGDMDGDGFAEIAISNSSWRGEAEGVRHAVNLVYGSAELTPERTLDHAETTLLTPLFRFSGGDQPWLMPAGDVDGDGLADLLVGVAGGMGDVGRVYLVYGSATRVAGEGLLEDVGVELTDGIVDGRFGARLAGVGDFNGDGRHDFVIVALGRGDAAGSSRAHLYYGKTARIANHARADAVLHGLDGYLFGLWVAAAGNVDRDQYDDFLIASQNERDYHVHLVRGSNVRLSGEVSVADVGTQMSATDPVLMVGGVGDLDGDELDDFAVGSMSSDAGHVFHGDHLRFREPFSTADASATLVTTERMGWGVIVPAGDVNGDGHADYLMGDTAAHAQRGAVYLVLGDGTRRTGAIDLETEAVTFLGREATGELGAGALEVHDRAGASIGAGHDVNGDGLDDFVIGAPGDAIGDRTGGRAYVVFGVGEGT